jgi:hypothetical protein
LVRVGQAFPDSSNHFAHERIVFQAHSTRNGLFKRARSTGQCNTACSLSAGVWKPKVFRGR